MMKSLWLALLILAVSACGGTEAGNPAGPQGTINSAGGPEGLVSTQIVSAICGKLTACNPSLTLANCVAGVESESNLATSVGVPPTYPTLGDVIQGETSGVLRPDPVRGATCVMQIEAELCASAPVGTAYNPIRPTNYAGVINMIPNSGTSCAGVF